MQSFFFRFRVAVLVLWIPIYLLIFAVLHANGMETIHSAFKTAFLPATIILLIVSADVIQNLVRKGEFWMSVVSVLIMLGFIEFAFSSNIIAQSPALENLRSSLNPSGWQFLPDFYAGFSVNPAWGTAEGDMVNERGFRGEEVIVPKPDGVFRVVAIGGSTTYGTGVARWQDSYPEQLEAVLHNDYGYSHVEVINAGQPDYNSWESLINLAFRVLDVEPDLIIYYENTNDAHSRLVAPDSYRSDNSGRRALWNYEEYELADNWLWRIPSRTLHEILIRTGLAELPSRDLNSYVSQECTAWTATEECMGMPLLDVLEANPPIYYERNLRSMIGIAQAHNVDFLLLTWASTPQMGDYAATRYYRTAFDENNETIQAVAEDMGIYFYDFAPNMPQDPEYWSDGRHMNLQGHQLQAQLMAEHMIQGDMIPLALESD